MLRLMREKAGSWFIKIILGAIVIVFIFWGVGSFRSQRFNTVAEVNGAPISAEEYQKAYNSILQRYRGQFGDNFDENTIKMLGLRRQALDQLIDQTLMIQEAEKLNFQISDDALAESIQSFQAFQNNGSFDPQLYARVLSANRLTPEEFEVIQRQNLLLNKLRGFVLDTVKMSEEEMMAQYQWDKATVSIDYVFFDPATYEAAEVTEDDVKAYYDAHKENYKTEPAVKAQYVRFDTQKYVDASAVSEEEVKEYYDAHLDEFGEPKTVKARHILFKVDNAAPDEEVAQKKEKALEVIEMAKSGQDFAELAKIYSEGPTKDSGGDLGTFKYETMVKPFADKAFSMAAGEISEPIRTRFGWHIIKVEAVNEAKQKKMEEAAEEIRKKLSEEKAKITAYDAAEAFYDTIYEGDDLKKAVNDPSIEVKETGFFTLSGPADVKPKAAFAQAAFALSENQLSEIQELSDGYYLIQLMAKNPAEVDAFENVKDKVTAELKRKKKQEKIKADAESLLAKLNEGTSWEEAVKAVNLTPKSSDFFERGGVIQGLGPARNLIDAAFELTPEHKYPKEPLERGGGYYVIALKEQKAADPKGYETAKESIRKDLLRRKQMRAYDNWLAQIKNASTIEIDDNFKE